MHLTDDQISRLDDLARQCDETAELTLAYPDIVPGRTCVGFVLAARPACFLLSLERRLKGDDLFPYATWRLLFDVNCTEDRGCYFAAFWPGVTAGSPANHEEN